MRAPLATLLLLSSLLPLLGLTLSRSVHVIPLPSSSSSSPSSLTWDATSQHFIISSPLSSVSDAGILQTLATSSDPINSVSVDDHRRRLICASSTSLYIFDLRSPVPHPPLPPPPPPPPPPPLPPDPSPPRPLASAPLPSSSSSIAVDPSSGSAFIGTSTGNILTADLNGKISTLAHVSGEISGLAHVSMGYLLVVLKQKGEIYKIDAEDGAVKRVLMRKVEAEGIAVRSDGTAVVTGGMGVVGVKSGDGWAEAAIFDEFSVGNGERVKGVAMRDGKRAYVLVGKQGENGGEEWRLEEVEWKKEGEGEMVWAMVMVGFGLAYFMYWRFQMGKLVSGVNKKRA